MNDILGLINLRQPNPLLKINATRPFAAVPFAGKYRLLDFTLSSFVDAGLNTVGLLTPIESRSLMDHIRSGKEWNLARKMGGLLYLPMDTEDVMEPVKGDIKAYHKSMSFLKRSPRQYLLLSYSDTVHNINYKKVLEFHRQHNADATIVYTVKVNKLTKKGRVVTVDEDDRVTALSKPQETSVGDNICMSAILIDKQIFIDAVEFAFAKDEKEFFDDVIGKHLENLRVFGYNYKGYSARIDSVPAYYKASMDLLDLKTWRNLFFNGDLRIHTKIMDAAPAKYLSGAMVANSMVANGCVIDGTVENSILSRQVKVGRNAVVRNSIIMQKCVIGDDARLDGVICDKNAIIQAGAALKGTAERPLCIAKFAMHE
jgi:glucose-1-phosphate adenylyltransferase